MSNTDKEQELIPFTKSSLPILEFNFDDVKKELTEEMETYKGVVVTLETLKEDKKLAQELKSKGTAFNQQRLDKVKAISAPIVEFTNQMNELKDICTKSAKLISDQVEKFEGDMLVTIEKLLLKTLTEYRDREEIRVEFRMAGVESALTKLGAVTAKGALTKGSKEKLAAIASEELALQGKVDYRLLQLESESHKANLDTPLNKISVESFLFEDDATYAIHLEKVIAIEIGRQEDRKAQEKLNATIDQKQQEERVAVDTVTPENVSTKLAARFGDENSEYLSGRSKDEVNNLISQSSMGDSRDFQNAPPSEYDNYADAMMQEQASHQPEPEIQLKDGYVLCIATATFKVSVPHQVSEEMVQEKLVKMMADAGVTTLETMQVVKQC